MPPCTDDVISGDNLDLGVAIFSHCGIGRLGYYVVKVIRGLCGGGHPDRLDWNQSCFFVVVFRHKKSGCQKFWNVQSLRETIL